jgi:hypothetical protein
MVVVILFFFVVVPLAALGLAVLGIFRTVRTKMLRPTLFGPARLG